MATEQEIHSGIIKPLTDAFGDPKRNDPDGFFDLLTETLTPHDPERFPNAVKALITEKVAFTTWPSIAKVLDAVRNAPLDRPYQSPEPTAADYLSSGEFVRLLAGPMSGDAIKGGWALSLIDYVRDHGLLPTGDEERRLQAEGLRASQFRDAVKRGFMLTKDGAEVELLEITAQPLKELALAIEHNEAKAAHQLRGYMEGSTE